MMNNLIIIGAGKLGRELFSWAKQTLEYNNEWTIKGFLDNRPNILNGYNYDSPVLASTEEYIPEPNDVFTCAIGEPRVKKTLCEHILRQHGRFVNIIHPTVVLGENVTLGKGVILCPYVVISSDVSIGDFVTINMHSVIGHDVNIDNNCQINVNVSVNGSVDMKEGVTLGSGSIIVPNITIESNAVVGAGSVVVRNVKSHQTVFGNPAKCLFPDSTQNH